MKQLWLLATALGFAGLLTAQDAAPKGPVVVATDDRPVAASDEDEGNEGRFYIGAGIGGMRIHRTASPRPGSNVRGMQPYLLMRVGYDFADSPWSVEGYGMYGWQRESAKVNQQNILGLGAEALYHFDRYAKFDPYLAAGLGYVLFSGDREWQDDKASHVFAQAGVGAFWHINEDRSLRGDIRYHVAVAGDFISYTSADVGLIYHLGGNSDCAADTVAPLAETTTIEADARAYDEASEHSATLRDVTPEGSVDEMKLELHLQYAKDTSIIEPANYPALDELLRIMTKAFEINPEAYVTIDGHADRTHGSDHAYNQQLSEARAKSVMTYLSSNGIPAERMKAAGHSFVQPKDPVDLDKGTPSNRRTEVVIRGVDEATRAKIRAAK
jgi:outer membrane protein OmpA-like peptidoglycan-associated protein/opacity protein-like surface antigen